jgi:hypothetical protein
VSSDVPAVLPDPSLLTGLAELYDAETVLRSVQTRWLAAADARTARLSQKLDRPQGAGHERR